MSRSTIKTLSFEEREHLRHEIVEASEPIAQFWPMKTFIHHNPIHGLENLPFDQAIREAKHLLGGNGYLPNDEYRQFYREGRITEEGVQRAFERVGPKEETPSSIQVNGRVIAARDAWHPDLAVRRRRAGVSRAASGVESVAVCLLHSYRNPDHEIHIDDRDSLPALPRAGQFKRFQRVRRFTFVIHHRQNFALGEVRSRHSRDYGHSQACYHSFHCCSSFGIANNSRVVAC